MKHSRTMLILRGEWEKFGRLFGCHSWARLVLQESITILRVFTARKDFVNLFHELLEAESFLTKNTLVFIFVCRIEVKARKVSIAAHGIGGSCRTSASLGLA